MYKTDVELSEPPSDLTILEIDRARLQKQIDDLLNEMADMEAVLDSARIALHDVDMRIKELQRNAKETKL